MNANPAFLTWIDLTASDRDKVRRVLDLFNEQGTIDELGLGPIRDFLSDALFPGTSVLHTRLRYVLFIPWLYRQLEARPSQVRDVAAEARALELRLVDALKNFGDQEGIIGAYAGSSLSRLPSQAYWSALVRWGIFDPNQSQSWYFRRFRELASPAPVGHSDDTGVAQDREETWNPHLPDPPDDLLESASFDLTAEEAEFVRGCIEANVPHSLLAWLVREGAKDLGSVPWLWQIPGRPNLPARLEEVVEMGRRFSLHLEGAPLLYNLVLAETRKKRYGDPQGREQAGIEKYEQALAEWAGREAQEAQFDPEALWDLGARHGAPIKAPLKRFVERWTYGVAAVGPHEVAESEALRDLVEQRERALKGPRARLVNESRLLDWRGDVGVGRMDFRWPQVRTLLTDLHEGLAR
ncbi:hypothetical protein AN478_06945 [Thiohalorhabdus denitrificans]|uniref:Uncharacterized protein n=1 Tax=Thiohalorhabdus denitrificans TaxID=381306 RepID=A0A0P9CA67_9GAMM|nr:DUF6361 family protein [Thiohalorhabdus denitrificans]KPV39927.1 hypothetical protein AN478_06945 [Thiohalorhabdus denitrificans]SCY08768.1 hypothetical protein SAMN05661077_1146 [Thiohalorhabdus denitrificans]